SGYAPYAMSQPWGGANNATGVIRRYTETGRRITASGYAPYAMPTPGVGRITPPALTADTPKPGGG
ncbi:hypothetical protein NS784_13280, partial [Pseudomonas aeruginosa]|nr:hypothetical protein [Pseudomonas aeruginosa]